MMKNLTIFGAMLVFLVSLESCTVKAGDGDGAGTGCPAGQVKVNGACAAAWDGKCPTGQINIDDGKTSAATSCKAIKHVANRVELAAEIVSAVGGTNWTVNLNYIDVSAVIDMSRLFESQAAAGGGYVSFGLDKFNGRIDKWDTSNVISVANIFHGSAFDQDISKWDTARIPAYAMSKAFTDSAMWNNNNMGKHAPWYCTVNSIHTNGCP